MPATGTPVTTWVPSRKWATLVVTGVGSIGTLYITDMTWDSTEWGSLITLAVTAATTYLVPNST